MLDGSFSQLIVPVSSAAGDIMCMVSPFKTVPYAPASGRYMDFRWLQRCDNLLLVSVTKIDRREHVVPFLGKVARQAGDTRSHYLVNSGRFYEEDKDKALKIFCSCLDSGCAGRAPRPSAGLGAETTCLVCGRAFLWY